MVSIDRLIKVGVNYTDKYFEDLKRVYTRAYNNNESLEEFLNSTSDYSIGNPLEANDFKENVTNLIVSSTNDIRFSRPAQKALMNTIIQQTTGELIVDVGDEVKQSVRDIVAKGYNSRTLSRQKVADEITSTLDSINKKRARTIARTEIKRAQTTSNYVVAKERGANAYRYKCGAKPCDICKVDCGEVFPIDDLEHLPPRHPNCMCSVTFFKDPNLPMPNEEPVEPTEAQLKQNLTPEEYVRYTRTIDRDIKNYEKSFKETFKDDDDLVALFKQKYDDAINEKKSLTKKALEGGEQKEQFTISPMEDYSMETLKNDVPMDTETFDKLMNWSKKRASKNKIEYGYQFDTSTGKLIGDEVRGKKGSVTFTQQGSNIGSMHTHPPVEGDVGGGSFPSKQDIKVYRSQGGADHLIGSPTEIWYVHAEENLNSSVLGQREIDAIYGKVYKEVTERGQQLVKEGKLKTDNDSLRKFLDKEIGDGLLKEFNTPEWAEKGFYIRRVYR